MIKVYKVRPDDFYKTYFNITLQKHLAGEKRGKHYWRYEFNLLILGYCLFYMSN